MYNDNNNNEIFIEHEPLVYTRAWCAVQTKTIKKKRRLQLSPMLSLTGHVMDTRLIDTVDLPCIARMPGESSCR